MTNLTYIYVIVSYLEIKRDEAYLILSQSFLFMEELTDFIWSDFSIIH